MWSCVVGEREYGFIRRMLEERLETRVHHSSTTSVSAKGKPPMTREGEVEQCMRERTKGESKKCPEGKRS